MTLPQGWVAATIGDLVEPIEIADPAANPDGLIRYVDIGSIDNQRQKIGTPKEILGRDAPSRARRRIKGGDVLFSTVRPYLKNIAMVPSHLDGEFTSTGICVLRAKEGVQPGYLFKRVTSHDFIEAMTLASDGTMYPAIADRDVLDGTVALPPEAEQRRIVAKLDALTARLARARAELERVPVVASNLRLSALDAEYASLTAQADRLPLRHFITSLDQGWSPKCESDPSQSDDTWGVLKTTAIQALEFRPSENKSLPSHLSPRPRIEVQAGDVLVTRAGPRVRCGVTCWVRQTRPKLMLADKMYRLKSNQERALPLYLALMLNAPQSLALLEEMKTGISDSGLNLTQEKFLSIPIPSAPLALQREMVDRIELAFARADRLEAEAARARSLIDRLESAILAKAFRGELVPQDPNDEPSSVLLDRIRAERAAAPKVKRGRRAKADA